MLACDHIIFYTTILTLDNKATFMAAGTNLICDLSMAHSFFRISAEMLQAKTIKGFEHF